MKPNPFLAAAQAEDLGDLLDHIAWTEVLRPALLRERDNYTKMLVNSTLGLPVTIRTEAGAVQLTHEQLAGKIYGIDYIIDLVEKILTKGTRAVMELRSKGLSFEKLNGSGSDNSDYSTGTD